eukprot:GFUD01044883.1.p1 GENE.GFUD01044883.1~~GFUD01044883.1.p1  ORF type:complete len:890 (-),score=276.71 GFUD01044883.1:140-2809(-)
MKPSRAKTPSRTGPAALRTPLGPVRTPLSARTGRTPAPTPRRQVSREDKVRDPVEVFCRVRPGEGETSCLNVLTDTTVQLVPPASNRAYNTGKETQCSFKHVFDEESTQGGVFDRVGMPLVTDLLQGKNGLLFTYGVTGSGKTHTMQGTSKDGGIMTRAIDVIFNSVSELQTRKFQLKPDKLNGFEILSDCDAALERQQELVNNIKTPGRRTRAGGNTSGESNLSNREVDTQKVTADEDMQYAVFVSYVEIYNNYTYDLLDQPKMDMVTGRQKLASKILREDSYRDMYVHGVTEVEVKSSVEALEAFNRGQKQRSVSATILNLQSSRSHSIFNMRVVAVPLDPLGEDILSDPSSLMVGQLALVDLAGSERTNRTGNTGQRLQEASKINQSLMTLRSCIEVLRDNQASGGNKAVPYRDSRVTHLFRNYFEGEGMVKMVVCVNPRPADYDENMNVMQFAELTQEVQIERAVGVRFDLGLTPGRRRANQVYKEAVRRLEEQGEEVEHLVMDLAPVYSLGPAWPPLELTQFDSEEIIERLRAFLVKRISTRKTLLDDQENKHSKFRELLSKQETEMVLLRAENKQMKAQLEGERKRVTGLEQRLVSAETANRSLNNRVAAYNDMKHVLENELDEKELALNAEQRDKLKARQKYKAKIQTEREKVATELDRKFTDREREIKHKHGKHLAKLNALKNLINEDLTSATDNDDENVENGAVRTVSDPNLTALVHPGRASRRLSSSPRRSIAVSNPRHRRSKSTDADRWLDHRPAVGGPVPSNTLLQPVLRNRRSVTKLDVADLDTPSKYVLTTATQGGGGELETRLFKGDVIPTVSGGRQVVFDDVEVLTQESPTGLDNGRKRSYEEFRGIGERIADLAAMGMDTPARAKQGKRSRV